MTSSSLDFIGPTQRRRGGAGGDRGCHERDLARHRRLFLLLLHHLLCSHALLPPSFPFSIHLPPSSREHRRLRCVAMDGPPRVAASSQRREAGSSSPPRIPVTARSSRCRPTGGCRRHGTRPSMGLCFRSPGDVVPSDLPHDCFDLCPDDMPSAPRRSYLLLIHSFCSLSLSSSLA